MHLLTHAIQFYLLSSPQLDTPGYGSVVDAQSNFDMFMRYIGQTFDEKNKKISPFTEVSNNELMRSLVTGNNTKLT